MATPAQGMPSGNPLIDRYTTIMRALQHMLHMGPPEQPPPSSTNARTLPSAWEDANRRAMEQNLQAEAAKKQQKPTPAPGKAMKWNAIPQR